MPLIYSFAGKSDTETAELLGLHRTTVTKWRLYLPAFQASLSVRRQDIWGSAATKLRNQVAQAVDVLAEALKDGPIGARTKVAIDVLKLVNPAQVPAIEPMDPPEIVRRAALQRRKQVQENAESDEHIFDDPDNEELMAKTVVKVRAELNALANVPPPIPEMPTTIK